MHPAHKPAGIDTTGSTALSCPGTVRAKNSASEKKSGLVGCFVVHLHNDYLSSHSFRSISARVIWIPMVNRESRTTDDSMDGMDGGICFIFWVDIAIIRSSSRAEGMPELVSSHYLSYWYRLGTHMTTHRKTSSCYWMECAPRAVRLRLLVHRTGHRKNRASPAKYRIFRYEPRCCG